MKGHNKDVIDICLANGATSTQYNTALLEMAIAQGATVKDMPTALRQVLSAAGYTGALPEMWQQFVDAGATFAAPSNPQTFTHTLTVEDRGSGSYGTTTPATNPTPGPGAWTETGAAWLTWSVASTGVVQLRTDVSELYHQEITMNVEGFSGNPVVLVHNNGIEWRANGRTDLNTYLAANVGVDLDFTITYDPYNYELVARSHFGDTVRGYNNTDVGNEGSITPGTIDGHTITRWETGPTGNFQIGVIWNATGLSFSCRMEGWNDGKPLIMSGGNGVLAPLSGALGSAFWDYMGSIEGATTDVYLKTIIP